MPGRDPIETDALALEIDSCVSRTPLHELVVDAERQTTEIVAPDQFGVASCGDFEHDVGDWVVAERVLLSETGEVRLIHVLLTVDELDVALPGWFRLFDGHGYFDISGNVVDTATRRWIGCFDITGKVESWLKSFGNGPCRR